MGSPLCSNSAQTMMAFLVGLIEGYTTGIYGPTLPQLICLFDTDVKTISSLFFVFGFMNAAGCILCCYLQGRFSPFMILSVVITVESLALVTFPYSPDVIVAICIAGLSAFGVGISCHCRVYIANHLWPNNAFAIHLVIAGFAMGAVVASAVATPFLNHGANITKSLNNNIVCSHLEDVSSVKYPFIILGCIGIPFIFINLGCFVKNRDFVVSINARRRTSSSSSSIQKGSLPFVVVFFLHCLPVAGLFIIYGDLLTTYGVTGPLHVGTDTMAVITAIFWASFVMGRLLITALSTCLRQILLIVICYIGLFLAIGILLVFDAKNIISLGIGTALFGLSSGPFSALAFSYTREFVELSKVIITIGGVGEYTGSMLAPYIGGIVMGEYGPESFFYVITGIVCVQLIIFVCYYVMGHYCLEPQTEESVYSMLDDQNDSP